MTTPKKKPTVPKPKPVCDTTELESREQEVIDRVTNARLAAGFVIESARAVAVENPLTIDAMKKLREDLIKYDVAVGELIRVD